MTQQLETRLVNEWLATQGLTMRPWKKARVGPLPDGPLARMYTVVQRYVDAIFVKDGTVYFLEAKLRPSAGDAGKLQYANRVFPETADFAELHGLPRKMIFLTTLEDPIMRKFYEDQGIEYVVYAPDWAKEVK
jgi:hypothetical protein